MISTAARAARWLAVTLLVGAALAACTAGGGTTPVVPKGPQRPNIVFVLTDDLSSDLVPFMPHVLALEKSGTSFTNYTVTDSLCCPSRASIFTGQYPHDTHVLTNMPPFGGFPKFYKRHEELHTFATALRGAGYRTAMMGKYLNDYHPKFAPQGSPYVPPGWSEWDVAGQHGYPEFNYTLNHDHQVVSYGHAPGDYLTTVLQHHANSFITQSAAARRPFLLEVATFAPHWPFTPAPADRGTFPRIKAPHPPSFDRLPTDPPSWLAHQPPLTAKWKRAINIAFQRRVEAVQSVDRMIGSLERTLIKTGQARNTYIVFSSDNGYHTGEYRLTLGKLTAFDTDIRVPLVVTGPGVPAGAQDPAVVQNVDLAPTFEQIAGARVPAQTDGRSMLPLLRGRRPADWPTLALIEHHGPDYNRADPDHPPYGSGNPPTYVAIRAANFTYVRYTNGNREYYDLRKDPYELHNVASSLPAATRKLLDTALQALHTCHGQVQCQRASHLPELTTSAASGAGAAANAAR